MLYIYYYFLNNFFFQKFFKNIFLYFLFCSIIFLEIPTIHFLHIILILTCNTQVHIALKDVIECIDCFT